MKPLLKWAGGKRHIVDELCESFPDDWEEGTYFEPFIGGAAMYLHLEPAKAKISDLNLRLIEFYKFVKNSPAKLTDEITCLIGKFDAQPSDLKKDFYLSLRKKYNETKEDSLESAAHLYVINKLCFNGLYRENSKGFYNVPFGQKKKFPDFPKKDFFKASAVLQDTKISHSHFYTAVSLSKKGDFIYFDPPYIPINATASFTSYNSNGFGESEQKELAELMISLASKGVNAVCSNSDTALTKKIYGDLKLKVIQAPRMVSAKASGRGSTSELVITNF